MNSGALHFHPTIMLTREIREKLREFRPEPNERMSDLLKIVVDLLHHKCGFHPDIAWALLRDWNRHLTSPINTADLRDAFLAHGPELWRTSGAEKKKPINLDDFLECINKTGAEIVSETEKKVIEEAEMAPLPIKHTRLQRLSLLSRPGTTTVAAGQAGVAKSFWTMGLAVDAEAANIEWSMLPMEGDRSQHLLRYAAVLDGTWETLGDVNSEPGAVVKMQAVFEKHAMELERAALRIHENPCRPRNIPGGKSFLPAVTPNDVIRWTEQRLQTDRLVIIDPLSKIDFGDPRYTWKAQSDFIRQLVAVAAGSSGTVILVVHLIKKPQNAAKMDLSDVQGGADIARFVDCVLLLGGHDYKEAEVYRAGGNFATVEYNRVIHLAKCRHGAGTGQRVAFRFGQAGPTFTELGVIAPRQSVKPSYLEVE